MQTTNLKLFPELQDLPKDITQYNFYHGHSFNIKTNKDYVIYSSIGEILSLQELITVLESFKDKKIALLSTRHYPNQILSKYNCKLFYIPSAYAFYSTQMPYYKINFERNFNKTFLSLNNRAQWARQALYQFLIKFNLLDKFYFSYQCQDRFNVGLREVYDEQNFIIGKTWFNDGLDLNLLFKNLPMRLDDEFGNNDWGPGNIQYYETSFCSFVNETSTAETENHNVFLTEKTMKPLAYGHPMILFSSTGSLKKLQELGFETFNTVFNEDYDQIELPQQRFEELLKIALDLCHTNSRDIQFMYSKIKPILEHNYNHFWNQLPKEYQKNITKTREEILNFFNLK